MKRKLLSLLLALAMVLSLCSASALAAGEEMTVPPRIQSEENEAPSYGKEQTEPSVQEHVDPAFIDTMNRFALRSGAKLLAKKGGCYSPLSLYYALAIAAEGAQGQTAKELYSVLGTDADALGEQCPILYRRLNAEDGSTTLLMANSLWMDEEVGAEPVHFREEYLQRAQERYYAEVFAVDFSDAATGEKMSQWVSEKTKGKLSFSLEPDDEQMLSILNTVYYKSAWENPFDKNNTKKAKFTLASGQKKKIKFMHRTEEGRSCKGKGYTAASRALGSGRVTFYLPDKGVKVGSLLKKKDLFTAPRSKAKDCLLQWSVPKFKCESKWDAIPTLQKLGVKLAFTDDADFSALSDTPALITAIDQGTRFDMNEKGAEAAAYTHIAMSKATAVMPQKRKTVKMNLNRPFLYTITSAEGAVLFVGVFDGK